jgi:hypothetical protein
MADVTGLRLLETRSASSDGYSSRCEPRQSRRLIGERQQCLTLRTGETPARMLAQEKKDESEHQTQADSEGKWNNGHGSEGELNAPLSVRN